MTRRLWSALILLIVAACAREARAPRGSVASLDEATVPPLAAASGSPALIAEEDPHAQSPIPITSEDPVLGNRDALVTIVAFLDLQCPFCARVQPTLDQIRSEYSADQVRVVWKHNPLPFHKEARPAQEASVAVFRLAGIEAFTRFTRNAFGNRNELTTDNFVRWAKEEGVTRADLDRALADPEISGKLDRDLALAKRIGATGTPAFRINGITLSGAQPFDRFAAVIDDQLRAANELLNSDVPRREVSLRLTETNYKEPEPATPLGESLVGESPVDTTVHQILINADDPVRGPKDALVTIVEWSDFQCPFCKRVEETLERIRQEHPDDVRIVWKDNPLPFHKEAQPAARFAHYVRKQRGTNAFWTLHDELFENQSDLGEELYERLSKERGLSWPTAKRAIESDSANQHISDDQAQSADFNARGTPHFFINGRRLSGAQPYEKFEELIVEQLAVARQLVENGVQRKNVYDELMKTAVPAPGPEKRTAPPTDASNPSMGPKNAPVVIQQFQDFQCPYCQRSLATMKALRDKYPKKVRIVFRHLPLPFHKDARLAAEASMEAFAQKGNDGFFAYHDLLFENQKELLREDLEEYAESLGLNMPRFRKALDDGLHRTRVEADEKVAQEIEIRGTPAFLVNDYFLSGAQPSEEFERRIKLILEGKAP